MELRQLEHFVAVAAIAHRQPTTPAARAFLAFLPEFRTAGQRH
jgi:hypothetical protein